MIKLPPNLISTILLLSIGFPAFANSFNDSLTQLEDTRWWRANGWSNGYPFFNSWEDRTITFSGDGMQIAIDETEFPDTGYPYQAGELRSHQYYGYGCYEIEMKPIEQAGVISSFFLFAGPYDIAPNGNGMHNEIDIEFLGNNTRLLQVNYWTNDNRYENAHEKLIHLNFNAADEFHHYAIEWRKQQLSWFVDGQRVHTVKHTANEPIPQVSDTKLKIMLNAWVTDSRISNWAGLFEPSDFPIVAKYRNFKFSKNQTCNQP